MKKGIFCILLLISNMSFAIDAEWAAENIDFLKSQGAKQETLDELKKSHEEYLKHSESMLQRLHNAEVWKEALVINNQPKYKADRTNEVQLRVMKELKIPDYRAKRLMNEHDSKVEKIWEKMKKEREIEIKQLAEKIVLEKEEENFLVAVELGDLMTDEWKKNNVLLLRSELMKKLQITEQEAEALMRRNEQEAIERFSEIYKAEIKKLYKKAQIKVIGSKKKL